MLVTEKERAFVKKLFEGVEFPIDFGTYNESDSLENDEEIMAVVDLNTSDYFYSLHGASKYILINDKLPYVIKIPFNGFWEEVYEEEIYKEDDIEDVEEDIFPKYVFTNFECAGRDSYCDDAMWENNYCETEARFYQVIEEGREDIKIFFAETRYCTAIDGKRIYLQEKVIPYSKADDKYSHKSSPLAKELSKKVYHQIAEDWIEAAIIYYGEELTKKFIDFLDNDDDIGEIIKEDLHNENYGYREDGSPCLLDYSGYSA